MKITVVITTWQVPFAQVVVAQSQFTTPQAATDFVNQHAAKWWADVEGERCLAEGDTDNDWPYEPVTELGYTEMRFEAWGGESGFQAMLDAESAAALLEAHYKREFDAKGLTRPGYLINAYVAGHKPGGMTEAEADKYQREQAEGLAALDEWFDHVAYYSKPKN